MAKVNFKYRIEVTQSYVPTLYKSKTIEIDLPKNEHGVILHLTLAELLEEYIKNNLLTSDTTGYRLLSFIIRQ